jgi:C4-type Zn-finger protein
MNKVEGLKQKISNIIQCRIDIAEQDKETAIRNELMVLKRELLETLDEVTKQIQDKRDKVTVWVKNNLIDRKDFVDDDDFNGYALELSNAIRVFINRQVLVILDGEHKK